MTLDATLLASRGRKQPARTRAGLAAAAGIAAMAAAGGSLPGASASSSAAASVEPPPVGGYCRVIAPTMTQCVYEPTGGHQIYSVPSWQSTAYVGAGGAEGASGVGSGAAQGGRGGEVTTDVSVLPGSDLTVMVGGTPTSGSGQGGWPDGGFSRGGGGGGSSSILMGPAKTRILVAGGGGGGGTRGWVVPDPGTPGRGGDGGRTGSPGLNGSNSTFTAGGGQGGSLSGGGAAGGGSPGLAFGGCPIVWMPASSVSGTGGGTRGGQGGFLHFAGTPCERAGGFGGGGGGGWYAGGGGGGGVSAGAGGGGGSSYAPNSAATYGVNTLGSGYVTVAAEAPLGWQANVAEPGQARTYHAPVTTSARTGPDLFLMDTFGLDARGGAFHTSSSPDVDENLGGVFITGSRLASVSWGAKRIDVVGRALHGGVFHNSWNGSSWTGWKRLTPDLSTSSNPTVTSWGPGRLDVFVRDEAGQLKHGWSDNSGSSWGWETFAGQVGGDPTAVSWGPGRIDIFAQAPASSPDLLLRKAWNGQSWSGWSGFGNVAEGPRLSSAPTVVSRGPGRLDLWARSRDNHMVSRTFQNGSWTSWAAQGPVPSRPGEPVAAAAIPGTAVTVLVARGQLENELWTRVLP